jgi:hypothetical protein
MRCGTGHNSCGRGAGVCLPEQRIAVTIQNPKASVGWDAHHDPRALGSREPQPMHATR